VDKTITYDIHERMGDSEEAIAYYSTELECPDIRMDGTIRKSAMVSADQDLDPSRIHTCGNTTTHRRGLGVERHRACGEKK
jgi:hypothetical protein